MTDKYISRFQNNKTKYNLISETLILLDVICGSTTGGLGLLGLYINENNVLLINQILETLTEYCQVSLQVILLYESNNSILSVVPRVPAMRTKCALQCTSQMVWASLPPSS